MSTKNRKEYHFDCQSLDDTVTITIDVPVEHWERFCSYAHSYGFEGNEFLSLSIIFDSVSSPNFKKFKAWKMTESGLIADDITVDQKK